MGEAMQSILEQLQAQQSAMQWCARYSGEHSPAAVASEVLKNCIQSIAAALEVDGEARPIKPKYIHFETGSAFKVWIENGEICCEPYLGENGHPAEADKLEAHTLEREAEIAAMRASTPIKDLTKLQLIELIEDKTVGVQVRETASHVLRERLMSGI